MYNLLHLVATKPQLLVDHAEAYAELVHAELGNATAVWKRRIALGAAGLALLAVGSALAGVALMLWAVTPAAQLHAAWVLLAVPVLPFLAAIACLIAARSRSNAADASGNVLKQVKADMQLIREASAS